MELIAEICNTATMSAQPENIFDLADNCQVRRIFLHPDRRSIDPGIICLATVSICDFDANFAFGHFFESE